MLKECLEVFEDMLEKNNNLIIDTYTPADGTYALFKPVGNSFEFIDSIDIKMDKKKKEVSGAKDFNYRQICICDYNSKLIEMNKPVDKKKKIHSNNYMSFFIKKDALKELKKDEIKELAFQIIDAYYDRLLNQEDEYNRNQKDKELYEAIIKEIGSVNRERVENVRTWIKENIFNLEKYKINTEGKDYLKIFFLYPTEDFVKEGKRYFIPNIYNKNEYNVKIGEIIYGIPSNNMGMNDKKPYLENKTRKNKVPYLVNIHDIQVQKEFFDYLLNQSAIGKNNIYIDTDRKNISAYSDTEHKVDSDFNGIFIRLKKGKECEIRYFDVISGYTNKLKPQFECREIIKSKSEEDYYGKYGKRYELESLINEVLFSKYLMSNYFTDSNELPGNMNSIIKQNILSYRTRLFEWFHKGNDRNIRNVILRIANSVVVNSITNGYIIKAIDQYNVKESMIMYFEGGSQMADKQMEIKESLRSKINSATDCKLETDDEYSFAVGQLINYFISLNKSSKKPYSEVNQFLNLKNGKEINKKLMRMYEKYNYIIENTRRFNNLYKMIAGYEVEKINNDLLISGFLNQSLIYEKGEK